jgi:excisionase family DNA binding protein
MRITYDPIADAIAVALAPEGRSARTRHLSSDVALDFDARDRLIGVEVLNASLYYASGALALLDSGAEYLTVAEAAVESRLAPDTLRKQIANGRLAARKHGRDWLIAGHDLLNYLESREASGRPPDDPRARGRHGGRVAVVAHRRRSAVPRRT